MIFIRVVVAVVVALIGLQAPSATAATNAPPGTPVDVSVEDGRLINGVYHLN